MRVAVITGTAQGIGRRTAEVLAGEGYALALSRLGADPTASVVVEDAPNGIAAARAAGVGTVIGVGERAGGGDVDIRVRDLRSVAWDGVRLVVRPAP